MDSPSAFRRKLRAGTSHEDKDGILRRAQERVERVRAKKAAEAARKAAKAAAAREKIAQEARKWALQARQQEEEVMERRRLMVAAATERSQRGTSPRRPIVEIWKAKKGKGSTKTQPMPRASIPPLGIPKIHCLL
ncbi:MAG: hypothetical protein NXY57DRAFT_1043978 [Lentinula lateritia]|nr:MAG: hypothetical protein NXY57DRAFT_1043978 [Lentinula lateritia]